MTFLLALFLAITKYSPAPVDAAFQGGETLDYNLQWLRVSGGSARLTISPAADKASFRITSVAKSGVFFSRFFKVRDEIESIVSAETFSTIRYRKNLDERGRKKDELTTVEGGVARRKGKEIAVPLPIYDPLSLMYHLRTLDLTPGKTHTFTVLADGKIYSLEANVVKRETITTEAGTFKTVMVEPKMQSASIFRDDDDNRLWIWYTDDDRRIPVRIRSEVKVGTITVSLRGVRNGVTSIEPALIRGQ